MKTSVYCPRFVYEGAATGVSVSNRDVALSRGRELLVRPGTAGQEGVSYAVVSQNPVCHPASFASWFASWVRQTRGGAPVRGRFRTAPALLRHLRQAASGTRSGRVGSSATTAYFSRY